MSTALWACSIRSEKEWAEFDEAVADVEWVINQVIDSLQVLQASTPLPPAKEPAPSKASQKPKSNITWLARPSGKRQPKPSRKLLEAMES